MSLSFFHHLTDTTRRLCRERKRPDRVKGPENRRPRKQKRRAGDENRSGEELLIPELSTIVDFDGTRTLLFNNNVMNC